MTSFLGKPSVSGVRWIARILGTLLGLLLLAEFIEWVTGTNPPTTIRDYLLAVGWVLIILGFVAGWFKELVGALLILSGTVVMGVVRARTSLPFWVLILPALVGFLYLFSRIGTRKK